MPKTKKGPSLARVAKTYKKAYTKPKVNNEGARYFNEGANPYAIGTTDRKLKYKPSPRSATFGVNKPSGAGTKIVRRKSM